MKEKANYQPLIVILIMILSGLIFPSNSVDDLVYKTPLEFVKSSAIIFLVALVVYSTGYFMIKDYIVVKTND